MSSHPTPTAAQEVPLRHAAWWAPLSAVLAPLVLLVGWGYAGSMTPGFDRVAQPWSDLWAANAPNRWVMTAAVAAVGACHIATAVGLRPVDPAGRWLLGVGGGFMLLWAATPNHFVGRYFLGHTFSGVLTFACLSLWAAVSARVGPHLPFVLRRPVAASASGIGLLLLVVTFLGIITGAPNLGVREGALMVWTALWPLAVVVGARHTGVSPASLGPVAASPRR